MFCSFSAILLAVSFGLPLTAEAQKPPRVAKIRPVERGAFAEMNVGPALMLTEVGTRTFGAGVGVSALLGYDVTPFLGLAVGLDALSASGNGMDLDGQADALWLIPTAKLQLALLTSQRHFLWARAGAGWSFGFPDEIKGGSVTGDPGLAVSASVSYEYFTRLRRFSLGARLEVIGLSQPSWAFGVALMPTLKYTF